jgi:hypothetical protein
VTSWSVNDFLRFLITVLPSAASLGALIDFADLFVRTRQAGMPVPGHPPIQGFNKHQMFLSPYITAPTRPFAFTEGPPRPTVEDNAKDDEAIDYGEDEEEEAAMDVDPRAAPGPPAGPSKST